MPVYDRFEDFPAWQEAALLYNRGLDLLQDPRLASFARLSRNPYRSQSANRKTD
jgi:transposase